MKYQSITKSMRPFMLGVMLVGLATGYAGLKAEVFSGGMHGSICGNPSSPGCHATHPVFKIGVPGQSPETLPDLDTLIWGCHQDTIMVDATFPGAVAYQWTHTNYTSALIRVYPGKTYTVHITLDNQTLHHIYRVMEDETCPCTMSLPKSFSPNGDGIDDLFGPLHDCQLSSYEMAIFSRWGVEVFYTTDSSDLWDGTIDGNPLTPDIFVYFIKYRESENEPFQITKGDITLLK